MTLASAVSVVPLVCIQMAISTGFAQQVWQREDHVLDENVIAACVFLLVDYITLLFFINPVAFSVLNQDFRIKLKRPLRAVKRVFCNVDNTQSTI